MRTIFREVATHFWDFLGHFITSLVHRLRRWALNGLFQATSAGWQTEVNLGVTLSRCTLIAAAYSVTSVVQCPEKSSNNRRIGTSWFHGRRSCSRGSAASASSSTMQTR